MYKLEGPRIDRNHIVSKLSDLHKVGFILAVVRKSLLRNVAREVILTVGEEKLRRHFANRTSNRLFVLLVQL